MAQVVIVRDAQEAAMLVAGAIASEIRAKPDFVLGLATGASPQSVYFELAARIRDEQIDVSQVRGLALDEYVGLPPDHPASYHSTITREVVGPLGLNPELVMVPNGRLEDVHHSGHDFEELLHAVGGVDIQILGIGSNGHVGFNEPGSSLASLTRIKTLTEQTRSDNSRFFDGPENVPTHCVTQGIGTILRSKSIFLLAFGVSKADAVARAVEGPVSSSCPASALQLHPRVTVFADSAASIELAHIDYYRHAWQSKPEWQKL